MSSRGREGKPSYEKVNYWVRPAKSIERKMLCEALQRLRTFAALESYWYMGFGSIWFSDFIVFHRGLGLSRMTSIEADRGNRQRFERNRPYGFVDLLFGTSHDVLPQLAWDAPAILWLDYDSRLDAAKLSDISSFSAGCAPGSVLIVTVDAKRFDLNPDALGADLDTLSGELGVGNVPFGTTPKQLREDWGLARVYRDVVDSTIRDTLLARNGRLAPEDQLRYDQLFNFHYSDGTPMLTVGGLIGSATQSQDVCRDAFAGLSFVRTSDDPYLISVPILTFREIRHIEASLPDAQSAAGDLGIREDEVAKYVELHRYFPTFTEAEI